jgi:Predicted ATPase (AAA+ superfamily)
MAFMKEVVKQGVGQIESMKFNLTEQLITGHIFETFVLAELYKAFAHREEIPPLYFWRDKTGYEVDVVIDAGSKLIPIEIKSSETVNRSFFDGLKYYISLGSPVSETGILIHGGKELYEREKFVVRPWFQSV